MFKSKSYFTAAIGLVFTFAGSAIYSPQASAEEEFEDALEEVIVTASRREELLQDVALSVAVIDTGKFADAGLSSLTDILPFVPGVSVVDDGAAFGNSVNIRGINAVLAAGVATYVDDIPVGSSTAYADGGPPMDGTLLDLGTLDVLKGPQGTLYGASAMGGLLKFNTRDGSLEQWTGSISADLSSTNGGGLNQLYRVNANGPIITDTLGLSFTAFWKDKSGYIDNVTIPLDGWDDTEYYGGSGSLFWAATDDLEITLQGLYLNSTQSGLATIQANHADNMFMPGKAEAEPWFGKYKTGETGINPSKYKFDMLGLTINYDLDFGTLTSVTSTQDMSFTNTNDATIPWAFLADIFFPENAPHTSATFEGDLGYDKFTQELRLTSQSNQKFEWIAGGFYTKEKGTNTQVFTAPPDEIIRVAFPSNYKETSLFATGTYYFTSDFDASVGIRYADYSNDVVLNVEGAPLLAPIPQTKIKDKVTNYLFNMRYRSSENMSIYGRIASGYRPGSANFVLLDPITGEPLTQEFIKPDSLWSYEAGIKGSTVDGRFSYDVAAFYIDWQDYLVNVIVSGQSVGGNAEKASSKGLEASLSFAATDALTIRATLSYTDAKIGKDEPGIGAAKGEQLPNSPKWQTAVDVNYDFNMGDLPAYVGVAWRYKGKMPVGFSGFTDDAGVFWPSSSPRIVLDSYNLVDLRAGFQMRQFDISFYVTNLLDEWAYTNFLSSFSSISRGVPTRPRTMGAVLRWNFF